MSIVDGEMRGLMLMVGIVLVCALWFNRGKKQVNGTIPDDMRRAGLL